MQLSLPHPLFTLIDDRSVFRSRTRNKMIKIYFSLKIMNSGAERFNGLMAMIGIVAGIGAYAATGQIIPGIF
tara:strand:- start:172 stop:387 length:216 start_codon:yes stop_codon:yes gene_type:complete